MSAGKIQLPQIRVNNQFDITTETALGKATTAAENRRMIDLYNDKIQYAASPVWITKGSTEELYVGSGQWVSLEQNEFGVPTDLNAGYFLTCAHNWFEVTAGQHTIFDQVWVGYAGEWYNLRQMAQLVSYDPVADVMLFRTNIQLQQDRVLKLSQVEPVTGQTVWMCGFPAGYDTDSLTTGIIRDAHFNIRTGEQAVDSLFLNAPGIGGNSGSAILNADGDIVGIYTFGYTDHETFGGGANLWTLNRSVPRLKVQADAGQLGPMQDKAFLGMDWKRTIPQEIASRFPVVDANGQTIYTRPIQLGAQITAVEGGSPAFNIGLAPGMILLKAIAPNGNQYEFGVQNDQRTPGIMIHEQVNNGPWQLEFIDNNNVIKQTPITWNTYANWPIEKDNYLEGGTNLKVGAQRVD
jgi:S1-C subfamily serine protease